MQAFKKRAILPQMCYAERSQRPTTKRTAAVQMQHVRTPLSIQETHETHNDFYTEKTHLLGSRHWYYTHKNVRSAYQSLKRNLPFLFTYQKYPELHIPNTTNTIDGYFASLKKKVAAHHVLRRDCRYKVIGELLKHG